MDMLGNFNMQRSIFLKKINIQKNTKKKNDMK